MNKETYNNFKWQNKIHNKHQYDSYYNVLKQPDSLQKLGYNKFSVDVKIFDSSNYFSWTLQSRSNLPYSPKADELLNIETIIFYTNVKNLRQIDRKLTDQNIIETCGVLPNYEQILVDFNGIVIASLTDKLFLDKDKYTTYLRLKKLKRLEEDL